MQLPSHKLKKNCRPAHLNFSVLCLNVRSNFDVFSSFHHQQSSLSIAYIRKEYKNLLASILKKLDRKPLVANKCLIFVHAHYMYREIKYALSVLTLYN